MTNKINYSIVEADTGLLSIQSKIASFGLDHVTEKDIISFYSNFSQYAAWDTGLLPVEGSGILSIRTAGEYTQFAYQHKPGLYHVNWSSHEGGNATSYYVAQPYRIIICDMKDGNLLGARMFYSPYPITHPTQKLYHVNLPNINCKGYRGNAVGWICLYQNEDWSQLPLNERIVRFIERCSGVETYNDANMSETDGTRFYRDNGKPQYIWDPIEWQSKSTEEGFEWTLDENLWIPVLVKSMDSQGSHQANGINLTLADALVGDYQAYYYDQKHTKPINAIIRPDKSLSDKEVMSYFTKSYTVSDTKTNHLLNNTFQASSDLKDKTGSSVFTGSSLLNSPENHNQVDTFNCSCCDDNFSVEELKKDYYENEVCEPCFNDNYVWIESIEAYFHNEDGNLSYAQHLGQDGYYHDDFDTILSCYDCGEAYAHTGKDPMRPIPEGVYDISGYYYCHDCAVNTIAEQEEFSEHSLDNCIICNKTFYPSLMLNSSVELKINVPSLDYSQDPPLSVIQVKDAFVCLQCSKSQNNFICPCGIMKNKSSGDFSNLPNIETFKNEESTIQVFKSCTGCKSAPFEDSNGSLTLTFQPTNLESFKEYHVQIKGKYNKFHEGVKHFYHDPF